MLRSKASVLSGQGKGGANHQVWIMEANEGEPLMKCRDSVQVVKTAVSSRRRISIAEKSDTGGIEGYQLADANGTNYWWGTKQTNWGYGKGQWSINPWSDRPMETVKFGFNRCNYDGQNCLPAQLKELDMRKGINKPLSEYQSRVGTNEEIGTSLKLSNYQNTFTSNGHPNVQMGTIEVSSLDKVRNIRDTGGSIGYLTPNHTSNIEKVVFYQTKVKYVPVHGSSFTFKIRDYPTDPAGGIYFIKFF